MTKNEAIRRVNERLGGKRLGTGNTHWSNVVSYGSEEGWWLNVPFHKFRQDLNLLLNVESESVFLHLSIPANSFDAPERVFRDKDGKADIFMPTGGRDRLVDVQSGSGRSDLSRYVVEQYQY